MIEPTKSDAPPSVNDIFRLFGPAYLAKYRDRMSIDQIRATDSLMYCRSIQAGSVLYRCKRCMAVHRVPKSCGNRHCPTCQGHKAKAWLAEQQQRLLPCPYFMLTFTVPMEFRPFMRSHPRECYKALFNAAYKAMAKLAKDPKYIGSASIGMTGVLHTWGRDLNYHPHVHFIVPGGAIGKDGASWVASGKEFFLPVKALSKIYRAKYKAIMSRCGLLDEIPANVWSKPWNVNSKAVGDGRKSLRYLAPYVFRVAIGNYRIVRVWQRRDDRWMVTFLVRPSGQTKYRPMTLDSEEFLRRFLQHVLPRRFQKVRHFGFMHKRSKWKPNWLSMLVTVNLSMVYVLMVMPPPSEEKRQRRCPECGGDLEWIGNEPFRAVPDQEPNAMIDTS